MTEVARVPGATARRLRHYDAIGLLQRARIGAGGHRYSQEAPLLARLRIVRGPLLAAPGWMGAPAHWSRSPGVPGGEPDRDTPHAA
ncbi:MerR family DNA-binding transcriptional regulator [Streptomyces sp. MUSC 125]|uniref:MerR family DNA-binding transcriptional regulator n=1 Tax=Streptomyces sp. MUSC 125 TaxID=1428624 RepID=UPI000D147264